MNLTLLGTGAADGWPNPHCRCASCTTARSAGTLRGQTSALLDGTLLLDCGPETPHAAQRAGLDLTGLRHVLLTHLHPDHCSPAFLLFRGWVSDAPLDVLGPADVVEEARRWVAPDSPVRFVAVAAGDRHRLGDHDVRVLPAAHGADGSCVLYDVHGPGGRVLYATDTGPLPQSDGRRRGRRGLRRGAARGDVRGPPHPRHRPPRPVHVPRAAAAAARGGRRHRGHRRGRRTPLAPQPRRPRARPAARGLGRPGRRRRHHAGRAPRAGAGRPHPGAGRRPVGQVERRGAPARGRGVGDLRGHGLPRRPRRRVVRAGPARTGPAVRRTGRRWRPSTSSACWRPTASRCSSTA